MNEEATEAVDVEAVDMAENLILFSDGTGNSSAKLFKTNVWRMYEAVDLGPDRKGRNTQVAYYDNGIGTQAIRLFAALAGIFGFGLKNNVLRLYRFACANVTPGCRIYCFGFSRGAFTIRIVAAILAEYGIANPKDMSAREFNAVTLDVFRAFMRKNEPNVVGFTARAARWLRDGFIAIKRAVAGPRIAHLRREPVNVHFVGVWDTVAAYGGPIVELTRGIDDYIWPLSMTDTALHPAIVQARHAVAIDDERDAFWPVLWDEVAEARGRTNPAWTEEQRARAGSRLKQVWFAGMHSDVGGGYPDESLSYVSLIWMMDEAEAAGLRLLPSHKLRVRELANALGPIHDSRGGFGFYYRPQPRKVAAFVHPQSGLFAMDQDAHNLEHETLSLRDPIVGENPKPPHGVLLDCRLHASVVSRLVEGTNGYAPPTLPPRISIEPYSKSAQGAGGNPMLDQAMLDRLPATDWDWYDRQERLWDAIFWRRVLYFSCAAATVLLATSPWWSAAVAAWFDSRHQYAATRLTSWSVYNPFGYVAPYIRAFQEAMIAFVALALFIVASNVFGTALRADTTRRSRKLWDERIARLYAAHTGKPVPAWRAAGPNGFTRWRISRGYQWALQAWKWRVLPPIFALALVVAGLDLVVSLATQIAWTQRSDGDCPIDARYQALPMVDAHPREIVFPISALCQPALYRLQKDHRYEIAWEEVEAWADDDIAVDLRGVATRDLTAVQVLAIPLRRLVDAPYLNPIVEVRSQAARGDRDPPALPIVKALDLRRDPATGTYSTVFQPDISGQAFFYVNDAALFGDAETYYANNKGIARVRIRDLDAAGN